MMFGFKNTFNDEALKREEQELRALVASMGAEKPSGPSDAYWAMLPQRVMARVRREEQKETRPAWIALWKPAAALSAMTVAVAAFIMFRTAPATLDTVTASLSANEVQVVEQAQTGPAPAASDEEIVTTEIADAAKANNTDIDAALTLADLNADEEAAASQANAQVGDQPAVDNLSDADADAVIQSLKGSL